MVERSSAFSRCSSDAWAALGRHRSVLARKIPASAAPTAPRPNDHMPIPNSSPSSPDNTERQQRERNVTQVKFTLTHSFCSWAAGRADQPIFARFTAKAFSLSVVSLTQRDLKPARGRETNKTQPAWFCLVFERGAVSVCQRGAFHQNGLSHLTVISTHYIAHILTKAMRSHPTWPDNHSLWMVFWLQLVCFLMSH